MSAFGGKADIGQPSLIDLAARSAPVPACRLPMRLCLAAVPGREFDLAQEARWGAISRRRLGVMPEPNESHQRRLFCCIHVARNCRAPLQIVETQ
jgi:hypothetical protein